MSIKSLGALVLAIGLILASIRAAAVQSAYQQNERMLQSIHFLKHIDPFILWQSCQCPGDNNTSASVSLKRNVADNSLEAARESFYAGDYTKAIEDLQNQYPDSNQKLVLDYFLGASHVCRNEAQLAAQHWRVAEIGARSFRQIRQCQQAGQTTRAGVLYDLALSIDPRIWDGTQTSSPLGAWFYQPAADVARDRGEVASRLHWLQLSWDDDPDALVNNYRLGEYYEQAEELKKAQYYYARVKTRFLDEPAGYLGYARVSFGLGEWDTGVEAIEILLTEVSPDSAQHWQSVAWLVKQHANPALCHSMDEFMDAFTPTEVDFKAAVISDMQAWCK